ncbi:MAG: tetratricopeptide repeat protein [Planctomycetes bacterium]|nr:tetratricopeptide repeat protein [Planctomycetota bacterium]
MFYFFAHPQMTKWRLAAVVLLVVAMPAWASAQTSSDLLEKAVYAEETVGNLDEAIDLYGQVIAEAKVASSIGAEAQYRLGLCFEKQDETKKAREAFQAVVDDFPKEAKFVSLAKKRLPGAIKLLPVPWKDGQQLHMEMTLPTGMAAGKFVYCIDASEYDGQPAWLCSTRGLVTLNGGNSYSEVFCDKQTFAPLASHWKQSMLGEASAKYAAGKASINIVGRDDPLLLDFTVPGYDNEQAAQVFRRLPLKVGFHTKLTVITTLGGNAIPLELDVPKKETITTAAGQFECYRLELNIGQTFWISDDADRYLVHFEAGGIVVDLTRVEQRKQDESVELTDDQFALTLPGGWFSYEPKREDDGDDKRVVHLLDRRAIAMVELVVVAKDSLDEDEQVSPEAWIELALKKSAKRSKSFKVRDEGIGKVKLGEQEAATVVFDFEKGKKAMTGYNVALFGTQSAIALRFTVPSDQFEASRGEFDEVVRTLRAK